MFGAICCTVFGPEPQFTSPDKIFCFWIFCITIPILAGSDSFGNLIEDPSGTGNGNALYAGDYLVQITDANGCIYEHNFSINEPDEELLINLEPYDPICFSANVCSGSVTANPTGGQGSNYTYTWFNGSGNIIISGGINSLNNWSILWQKLTKII